MKLKHKLMFSFAGLGLLIASASMFAVNQVQVHVREVGVTHRAGLYAAFALQSTIGTAVEEGFSYLASRDAGERKQFYERLAKVRSELDAYARLNSAPSTEREITARLGDTCVRLEEAATAAFEDMEKNGTLSSARFGALEETVDAAIADGNELVLRERTEIDESTLDTVSKAKTTTYAVGIVSILLALIVGVLISTRIGASLARLTDVATRVRMGDHATRVGNADEGDELGHLACAFNAMLDELTAAMSKKTRMETALEQSEERARRMQRLEGLGRLAGGVAHDFNNLLAVISTNASLLAEDPAGPETPLIVSDIANAAERGARLTRQLLALSGNRQEEPTILKLDPIITSMTDMLGRILGSTVDVRYSTSTGARLRADRSQIEQIVMNLVLNARDAMPNGGTIWIRTEVVMRDGFEAGCVMLSVKDEGTGMSQETQARLFEPFFTTKPPGRGTGLGLATVYAAVQSHRGVIEVTSSEGHGTEFRVYLPAIEYVTASVPPLSSDRAHSSGVTHRVLLVDDDAALRSALARVLTRGGYEVTTASDGVDALTIARRDHGLIHAIVSDARMPNLGGIDLLRTLGHEQPGVQRLLMSGHVQESSDIGCSVLHKPFAPRDLLERLDGMLSARLH